jgi:DNA-binding transcriptional ArsR family regulator
VSLEADGGSQRRSARFEEAVWVYVFDQLLSYDCGTMTPELIEEVARRFALLGDPTRLRVLHTLMERGELSVGQVAEAAATSRFNASAHLNRLATGGFVARRRVGTTVYYRVSDTSLANVCDWMCSALKARARALAT